MLVERVRMGKTTLVGAAPGLVAGLVVITPAAGFVEPWAAIVMGLMVSPVCYLAIYTLRVEMSFSSYHKFGIPQITVKARRVKNNFNSASDSSLEKSGKSRSAASCCSSP